MASHVAAILNLLNAAAAARNRAASKLILPEQTTRHSQANLTVRHLKQYLPTHTRKTVHFPSIKKTT